MNDIITIGGHEFTLDTEVSVRGLDCRVVDTLDLRIAAEYPADGLHAEGAFMRLAVAGVEDPSEWEGVGHHHEALSGYCEVEGKFEYHHRDLTLLVRKSDLKAQEVPFTYEEVAAGCGFGDYA